MGSVREGGLKRDRMVNLRFSPREFESIQQFVAATGGRSTSETLRDIVFERLQLGCSPVAIALAKIDKRLEELQQLKPEVTREAL